MRLSNKQKKALEKITGQPWNSWHPDAIKAFFAYTDRGQERAVSSMVREDLFELISTHRFHAYTVKCWEEDFRKGLLFLSDFKDDPLPRQQHALEIYQKVMK